MAQWLPVDLYVGGIEHGVLHLLYARFYTKFLYDIGVIPFDEPFLPLFSQGMIYKDGAKMSKSKGNSVSPGPLIERYGADALRLYEMFIAPPEVDVEWQESGVPGMYRFLRRLERLVRAGAALAAAPGEEDAAAAAKLEQRRQAFVAAITARMEGFRLNTAVSALMGYAGDLACLPGRAAPDAYRRVLREPGDRVTGAPPGAGRSSGGRPAGADPALQAAVPGTGARGRLRRPHPIPERLVLVMEIFPWRRARIGVVADTHIPRRARALPAAVLRGLAGCDLILHAGDIQVPEVLAELERLAPVRAVAGNVDPPELTERLGYEQTLAIGPWRIGLVHGHREPAPVPGRRRPRSTPERALACFPGAHCVVFGHSHLPLCQPLDGVLAFNPGSPTDRRRSPQPSYGLLHVGDAGIRGEIVYI